MKFVCDSCHTKYSISDERVHGRVLKIRCKTCDHVITVREERASEPALDWKDEHTQISDPLAAAEAPSDEWFVSFDGDQEGPMALERAVERVRVEAARGREAHAWRPGFFVWLPVEEVPELARALAPSRPTPPKPLVPPAKRVTGPTPAVAQPAAAAKKSPTGPTPIVAQPAAATKKSPTGPTPIVAKAAAATTAGAAPAAPAVAGDSKPQPLPPPPTALELAPLAVPIPVAGPAPGAPVVPAAIAPTRPESRAARRAEEATPAKAVMPAPLPLPASPPVTAAPAPVPAVAAALAPVAVPAPSIAPAMSIAPALAATPKPTTSPSMPAALPAPELPHAAAAATADAAAPKPAVAAPDTGPVPLPPPPGADDDPLIIGEPSGSLNLDHLSHPMLAPRGSKVTETFGGASVTSPANGAPAAAPAPVVVVAGPVHHGARWHKWAALAGLFATLALGGAVVYLVFVRPEPTPKLATAPLPIEPTRLVEDKPIAVVDPPPPTIGPAADPKKPPAPVKRASAPRKPGAPALSAEQKGLAALYNDDGDKSTPREAPAPERPSSGQGASDNAIMAVVTQNRRSLSLCYDRVLKHDNTLKRARLVTHVKIGVSGMVTGVTVRDPEYATSEIGTCITQTIKRWHFPSADTEYETEFPILLQAD
jgi:Meckel syndrome type 1 protein